MEFSRKKSCNQCRTAKTRCSLDLPACVRCAKRNLACEYEVLPHRPNTIASETTDGLFHSWLPATVRSPDPAANSQLAWTGCPVFGALQQRAFSTFDHEQIYQVPTDAETLNGKDLHGEPAHTLREATPSAEQNSMGTIELPRVEHAPPWYGYFSRSSQVVSNDDAPGSQQSVPNSSNHEDIPMLDIQSSNQSSKFILARWEALKRIPDNMEHILNRKKTTKIADLLRGNFAQATFESYAHAFEKNELPPFIHRSCIMKDVGSQEINFAHLPEPLANCQAIIPMYLHRTASCRPLVCKTLLLEVQRLHNEFREYNEDELLHSLQALTMYIILLARDKERYDLVSIVTRITISEIGTLAQRRGYTCLDANFEFPKWEDWVREQSKIRTIILLYLMMKLLEMDIGNPNPQKGQCYAFDQVPLPCSKSLWEAETSSIWEDRYKAHLSARRRNVALKVGDLRQSLKATLEDKSSDMVEDLSSWSAEVDGFGAVILNCSLLGK